MEVSLTLDNNVSSIIKLSRIVDIQIHNVFRVQRGKQSLEYKTKLQKSCRIGHETQSNNKLHMMISSCFVQDAQRAVR